MSKKVLFIDRDGTLVIEPPVDYQLDSLEKLEFYPKVMRNLGFIRSKLDFEFAMVTNQDGLGTASFPEETFWPAHNLMMKTLEGEGITFDEIFIDRSMPEDMAPTRKPRTGMLTKYLNNPEYDLAGSFVIGDRPTDVELAKNLGCRAIYLQDDTALLKPESEGGTAACEGLEEVCALVTKDWDKVAEFLFAGERKAEVRRPTKETDIFVSLNPYRTGFLRPHAGANRQAWRFGSDYPCERRFGSGRASHHRRHCDCIRRLYLSGIGKQAWHRALWLCPDDG